MFKLVQCMCFIKSNYQMQRLSSTFTMILKLVIMPFYILSIGGVILLIFILPKKYMDFYIVIVPVWTVFASLVIYIISRMRIIYFDNEFLVISEKKKEIKIRIDQVLSVRMVYPFIYRIEFIEDERKKSFLFPPRLGEIVFAFKTKSNSIDNLRKKIMMMKEK